MTAREMALECSLGGGLYVGASDLDSRGAWVNVVDPNTDDDAAVDLSEEETRRLRDTLTAILEGTPNDEPEPFTARRWMPRIGEAVRIVGNYPEHSFELGWVGRVVGYCDWAQEGMEDGLFRSVDVSVHGWSSQYVHPSALEPAWWTTEAG